MLKKVIFLVSSKPFVGWRNCLLYSIPALLFSSFMIVGFSFKTTGFATCITFNKYQFFKSLFAGGGYFILFLCLIILLFEWLDELSLFTTEPGSTDFRWNYFYNHPFLISYILLFTLSIPYIVVYYPGIFMGDTRNQIFQGYNLHSFHPYVTLISEEVKIFNHHPVLHTLLLHYFIALGNLLHSYNFGIFLYAFFQLTLFIAVQSLSIMIMVRCFHLRPKYVFAILLYYIAHPFIQNYMMLITKDVLFTIFFLLFLLFGCLLLAQNLLSEKHYLMWTISMLGMILFRNEGIYIIVPTLAFLLCLNVSKKQVASSLTMIICFFLIWHHVVFPFFKVSEGSIKEMLSIPFQQTARYVKYRLQKLTPDEIATIDAVLDHKIIGKKYNPNLSDPVKNTFKEKSSKEELLRYFKIWAKMFFKEPMLYIDAIIANKYEYFYPEANLSSSFYGNRGSERNMKATNNNREIPFDFHHLKKLENYREKYEQLRTEMSAIPIFNVLRSASTYVWMLILLVFYTLKQNNKKAFALLVPFIMYFLVLMAGPWNGIYFRYIYPYAVTFPFLFINIMYLRDKN